jgi:sigma-B regulation protein RsbU (phosphoserine phosphatase)
MPERIRRILRKAGKVVVCFVVLLIATIVLEIANPGGMTTGAVRLAMYVCAFVLLFRYVRMGIRKSIWRLRNRILVTYLFIALVPVLLIFTFAYIGFGLLAGQIATYFATAEVDRNVSALKLAAQAVAQADLMQRPATLSGLGGTLVTHFPDLRITVRAPGQLLTYPDGAAPVQPPAGWGNVACVLLHDGTLSLWAHVIRGNTEVTALTPVPEAYASTMVPGLVVRLSPRVLEENPRRRHVQEEVPVGKEQYEFDQTRVHEPPIPPAAYRFDQSTFGFARYAMAVWDKPGKLDTLLIFARTRTSSLLAWIFATTAAGIGSGQIAIAMLIGVGVLFLLVEIVSLVIGVSLTRTITGAVHDLYEGTQRVIEGDFSWRIRVARNDQLAELTTSFNVMTGNVERLLGVARENERLQAELEIAREVQNQLYPKTVPHTRTMHLTAVCQPARMVSGDYYDYQCIEGNRLALSIGDVAGKGISAALLMATLQSSLRVQLRGAQQQAAAAGKLAVATRVSTAHLVKELNQQLYTFTAAEKYATFCLGIYDDDSGEFTYTNAGHLPPILVRNGRHEKLDINGMVVGAFPFATYNESSVQLESGDLLVFYTDGITEPENEYGEMFGDERLISLVEKYSERDDQKLISLVLDSVRQWTGSPELFDDMTLLLARRN